MKTFRKGGIHPADCKLTADRAIEKIAFTGLFRISLSQSIGAPAKPLVKPGDSVEKYQMLAQAGGFVSAPVHSPVKGTVKKIEEWRTPQGLWQTVIVVEADESQPDSTPSQKRSLCEALTLDPKEIVGIVANAGIVGLGGATFPTHVKLTVPDGKHIDTIVINGAECEPWLTCDDRLMQEQALKIIEGSEIILHAVGAQRILIGIENNKPQAIAEMTRQAEAFSNVEIITLKKEYPQGSEKQLIQALTGRSVPPGALPADVATVVDNVATAAAVYDAVCNDIPLVERVVTVTGPDVRRPGNYLIPIGVSLDQLIDIAGGMPENTGKVIAGGPMMGRAVSHTDAPVTKGTGGLLLFPESLSQRQPDTGCIRCGRCVDVCPMGLEPYLLIAQAENSHWEDMARHNVLSCLECGCCSYICPGARPLLDYIKLGKAQNRIKK